MKKLFTILAAVLITANMFAQAPSKMNYQAVIRNASNALVTSTTVGMQISILQGSSTGTAVYTETQRPSTNANGLVSLQIGAGTVVTGTFAGIDWSAGPYYIKTSTDPIGGTNYTIIGNNQLMSVPYALYAANAANGATVHTIGESYGGGIVFYVYDGGRHGLIGATTDQSTGIRWYGGLYSYTRARADGIGAGLKNTAIVIAEQANVDGNPFAATVCNEYSVTVGALTYGDWYLPSKYELNLLYLQKGVVGGFNSGASYWSSTEQSPNSNIYLQNFDNGTQSLDTKATSYHARAIRAF